VFKAKCNENGTIVALKKIQLDAAQGKYGFPLPSVREIKFLSQARHENCVQLLDIVKGGEEPDHIMTLVFEYVESDLVGYQAQVTLSEPHLLCVMKQVRVTFTGKLRYTF
jgi:serine/threonine protein kinase